MSDLPEQRRNERLRRLEIIVRALVDDNAALLKQAFGHDIAVDTRVQLHQRGPGLYYGNDGQGGALPGPGVELGTGDTAVLEVVLGDTALHIAARNSRRGCIRKLLALGASDKVYNSRDRMPRQVAPPPLREEFIAHFSPGNKGQLHQEWRGMGWTPPRSARKVKSSTKSRRSSPKARRNTAGNARAANQKAQSEPRMSHAHGISSLKDVQRTHMLTEPTSNGTPPPPKDDLAVLHVDVKEAPPCSHGPNSSAHAPTAGQYPTPVLAPVRKGQSLSKMGFSTSLPSYREGASSSAVSGPSPLLLTTTVAVSQYEIKNPASSDAHAEFTVDVFIPANRDAGSVDRQQMLTITKRYRDFESLRDELCLWLHSSEVPALPRKGFWRSLDGAFLERRRAHLQAWLQSLLESGSRAGARIFGMGGPGAVIEDFLGLSCVRLKMQGKVRS